MRRTLTDESPFSCETCRKALLNLKGYINFPNHLCQSLTAGSLWCCIKGNAERWTTWEITQWNDSFFVYFCISSNIDPLLFPTNTSYEEILGTNRQRCSKVSVCSSRQSPTTHHAEMHVGNVKNMMMPSLSLILSFDQKRGGLNLSDRYVIHWWLWYHAIFYCHLNPVSQLPDFSLFEWTPGPLLEDIHYAESVLMDAHMTVHRFDEQ